MAYWECDTGAEITSALAGASDGDEIYILEKSGGGSYSGEYNVNTDGLYIHAHEDARFSEGWNINASDCIFEDMIWEDYNGAMEIGQLGSVNDPVTDLTFTRCQWVHGSDTNRLWYIENVLFEDCVWGDIRSRVAGQDCNGLSIKRYARNVIFRRCEAWDNGSDWIQIMPNAPVAYDCDNILFEDCNVYINRPYGSMSWQDFSTNVGENTIDIKGQYTRNIYIRGGSYGGIQATVAGQDCSGENGCCFRVHFGAGNVRFENVEIYDSDLGIAVSLASDYPEYVTGPVWVLGCTFTDIVGDEIRNVSGLDVTRDDAWVETVLEIQHEAGDLSEYDSTQTDGGDLSAQAAAAMAGTSFGLEAVIDDTNTLYGQADFTQLDKDGWRWRCYLDPNTLTMAAGNSFLPIILRGDGADRSWLTLSYTGAAYQVAAHVIEDDAGTASTSNYTITDAPHWIEVDVRRATSSTASNGQLWLWIDDDLQEMVDDLDIDGISQIEYVRLGARGVDAGTGGVGESIYIDEFVLFDSHYVIGEYNPPLDVTPNPSSAFTDGVDPVVLFTSQTVTPDAISAITSAIGPIVVLSRLPPILMPTYGRALSLPMLLYKPTIGSYTPNGRLVDDRLGEKVKTLNFSSQALGGFWDASFSIDDKLTDVEDWLDRLGYHLEIYSPALSVVWEGFINQIQINVGPLSVIHGPLIDIGNKVAVVYSTVDTTSTPPAIGQRERTDYAQDTRSQEQYGIIEKIISTGGATETTAEQIRDSWLAENSLPVTSQQFNTSSNDTLSVSVDCLGYWAFLDLYTYNQTTNTGEINVSAAIQNAVAADPNGLLSTDYSQIASNTLQTQRYVNDDSMAWGYIKHLVSQGDASDNRYLFGIYNGQRAVYNVQPTDLAYVQRLTDNRLRVETPGGTEIEPWEVRPGRWLLYPDFLVGRTVPDDYRKDPRMEFIEQVAYSAPYGLTHSGSRSSTLAQKLAKLGIGG